MAALVSRGSGASAVAGRGRTHEEPGAVPGDLKGANQGQPI